MRKISEETKLQVIELRKAGETYKSICEKTGIGKGSVSVICKEAGLGQNIIELTPEKIEECQMLYDKIGNIKEVAKQTGVSYSRLRYFINYKNITPKSDYEYVKSRRKRIKQELIDYKGGKCEICGYNKNIAALEFHHINPEEKDFSISDSNIYKNLEVLKREVDKCMLVCANCHREIHNPQDQGDCNDRIHKMN